MRSILARTVVIVSLFAGAVGTSTASDFADTLDLADEVRVTDAAEFRRLLAQLDASAADALPVERLRLRLLHAYEMILGGDLQGAVREAKAVSSSEDADVEVRYRAGFLLANVYALSRDFTEGLTAIEQTLLLADEVTNKDARQMGLLAASILYNRAGQFQLGQHYAERVLAGGPSRRGECMAEYLRLEALNGLGDASSDDDAYRALIDRCQSTGESILTNLARRNLAKKWFAEGKVRAAVHLLEGNLGEVESTGYAYLIAEYRSLIAQCRLALGQYELASRHASVAIEQNGGMTSTLPLVNAYRTLYAVAVHREDMEAALDLYRKYADADKAYLDEVKAREMGYQLVRHQTLQKNQQIERLNHQNKMLELQRQVTDEAAKSSQQMLVLLAGLLASIGYWAYRTKRLQMRMRRMAEVDMLTGICSRQHFTQRAKKALAQCARDGEDAVLVMFDLDHFKLINDRFGHAAGDCALRHVAAACAFLCRPIDCFGRLGGEEFGILLPGFDLSAGKRLAEDCLVRFGAIDTSDCGHAFKVTASFGVATAAVSGYDLTRMLSHADRALYRAKRSGRNRVRTYAGEAAVSSPVSSVVPPRAVEASMEVAGGDRHRRSAALS